MRSNCRTESVVVGVVFGHLSTFILYHERKRPTADPLSFLQVTLVILQP